MPAKKKTKKSDIWQKHRSKLNALQMQHTKKLTRRNGPENGTNRCSQIAEIARQDKLPQIFHLGKTIGELLQLRTVFRVTTKVVRRKIQDLDV